MPIFVLTRHRPDPQPRWPGVTYVSDVTAAVSLPKDAADDHIELELLRAVDGPGVAHLRYRVRTAG